MASCGLMYGALNTLKTTNLGRIARYLYETFGLTSRMITADNEYDTVKDLVNAGVIAVFSIKSLTKPFPVLTKLSQGYWPVVRNGQLLMEPTPPDQMSKIGAYLIEGTTTIAELCHADHINKARAIGEDVVGKFSETVDTTSGVEEITYGKSARAHYQQVQDFVTYNLIPAFASLPIKWVWWTGHEYLGEDEATGQARLGPGTVGKAAVMRVPRVVGNTFHMVANEEVTTNPATHKTTRKMERRAYFEKHKDQFLKMQDWPAGLKLPEDTVEEWRRRYPEGFIELTHDQGVEEYVKYHQEIARNRQTLIITPGTEEFVEVKVHNVEQAATGSTGSAPVPAVGGASQTRPPVRTPLPPRRPLTMRTSPVPIRTGAIPSPSVAAPVTTPPEQLAEKLTESIALAKDAQLSVAVAPAPPSINDDVTTDLNTNKEN